MAMLIKNRARKPLAQGPANVSVSSRIGQVYDPATGHGGPAVTYQIGEHSFHITVAEFNRTLRDLRQLASEQGVEIK